LANAQCWRPILHHYTVKIGFVLKGLDFSEVVTAAGSVHSVGEASDALAKELEN